MVTSYHHTKEALSLPECCLHPSHLYSQLGSLMSEYDKWIEDISTVDFTVTSDTDKCRQLRLAMWVARILRGSRYVL